MKATCGETSDEESEVEDGDNDNLALMDKSDTDSDSDSSEAKGNEDEQHEIVLVPSSAEQPSSPPHMPDIPPLASIPPPNEGILRSLPTSPSVASPGSSIETSPTSLSSEKGSNGSPSHSSPEAIELYFFLTDIRSHYTAQEPDSPSFPKTILSPSDSASLSPTVGENPVDITISESKSLDDSIPLASLKKGARK
ncbi:hypothetical protein HAX54_039196 [Datura stramonium]|uniref:Uncharacterized protein n=1 Tax=Datura stramonium TaxID=4076 RepID=A0ABS8SJ64_DATST|nr:hypothetical protein [Datura stramonium]